MNEQREPSPLTALLARTTAGDAGARDELFRIVEPDLRRVAQRILSVGGWPPTAPTGTELVSMACVRLLDRDALHARDRDEFFKLLYRSMHDVLVDEARRVTAAKRGGGHQRVPMVDIAVDGGSTRYHVLDLHAALRELAEIDPQGAQVVDLRFFSGLSLEATAASMGCSLAQVRGHWAYARAWLDDRLAGGRPSPEEPKIRRDFPTSHESVSGT